MGKLQELPAKIRRSFGLQKGQGYTRTYVDFLLSEVSPSLARDRMMGKVVSVIPRTAESKSLVIRPPARWKGFEAGMYLPLAVQIDGRWSHRTYTISSTPEEYRATGMVTVTVRRLPEGKVSGWLCDRVAPGDWVRLGDAAGEFTLAGRDPAAPLLMLAGGIGITPLYSMLNQLAGKDPERDVVLIYYNRRRSEAPFLRELESLSGNAPGLTLVPVFTGEDAGDVKAGRVSSSQIRELCPDFDRRDILMCGPAGLMVSAREILLDLGVSEHRLFTESFGVQGRPGSVATGPADVRFARSGRRHRFESSGSTLLELAESVGFTPKHGCRAGVCHQCKTTKLSGVVRDIRSGAVSGEDREDIQLCVSTPCGRVELDI